MFTARIPTVNELIKYYGNYRRKDYLSPITIKRYHELLDGFEKYRKTNRILDVGCGTGYFLEIAKERGWDVYGTEFTDNVVEICKNKGLTMHQGVLDPNNYEPESFDLIISIEVLEHINNPVPEINNFHTLLRKGGAVYLTTPNFNSLLRYRLKADYDVIKYPDHLTYYTSKTLKKVFSEAGFKLKKIQTTGISISRFKTSKGIKTEFPVSAKSDDEKLRVAMEEKPYLKVAKKIANNTLTFFKVGDSLKATFEK